MALFKIFNNISSGNTIDSLSTHQQGYCYFDANTNKFYVDTTNAAAGLRQLNGTYYGECSTAAATTAKEVTIAGFKLAVGASVYVKFTAANTGAVGSLTLNVSGTGAKAIKRYGTTNLAAAGNIGAGMVCNFVYDGTNWLWVNHIDTDTNSDTKNTAGSTDTSSKIFLIGATSQAANPQTYSDNEVYATSGVLTAKTFNSTSLTASQAVSTDASKNLVSTNLTTTDPSASGTGISYIATITQGATGKISATKSTVRSASTSQTGVVQLNSATNSTSEALAATPKAVKSAYDLANTANTTANAHKFWANIEATSAASYNKAPEMATLKLNGNTSASAASTSNVSLVFDTTTQALNFVFA